MKKWLLGILLIVVVACGYYLLPGQPKQDSSIEIDGQPDYGGTLIIGISKDIETLNPLYSESAGSQELTHLLLLGLADLNDNSEFEPELAESWQFAADDLSLTYKMRKKAVWADGTPVSAHDVKFTYDVLMDPETASPRAGVTEFIKKVEVRDDHTIRFHFTEPYPNQLFDTAGEILPAHILKDIDRKSLRAHDFGRNPLSSGPFKINKWVAQQFIELIPNEAFYAGRPYLDRIIFKIIPDKTNLLMQLQSGEIDMMAGVPPSEVAGLKEKNKNIAMYHVDGRVYYYIGYNQKNELFKSRAVRTALTMALDRSKIIDALLFGYGRPCLGPLPPMVKWAYNEEVNEISYAPEDAVKALNAEGWHDSDGDGWIDRDGQIFEFDLITSSANKIKADVAVIVQEQLRTIGIKVNVRTLEWTTMLKQLNTKTFDAVVNGWSTSYYIDPTPIFHSTSTKMFNFISYNNPSVDLLIEEGRVEMDRSKASETWKKFQQQIYQDQPYTFLFWIDKAVAVNSKFINVTPLALSSVYNLEKWYLSNSKGM